MLSAFFSVAYLGAVAALAAFGLFGVPQIVRAAILLPGVVVGLSHTLMGSARGVGAWKVADAAAALERIGKTPAVPAAIAINRLAEAVTEAKSAIANRYGPASEKSGSNLRFT